VFDQPPLTAKEAFGRGFVHGSALLLLTLVLSLVSMLPWRYRFYLGPSNSLWTDFLEVMTQVLIKRRYRKLACYDLLVRLPLCITVRL